MTVDYLSDLHLDFYFNPYIDQIEEDAVTSIFDPIFIGADKKRVPAEVLIIAGDIGHYNRQNIEILKIFKKRYYKYIICVLGNHDYYLMNETQEDDYDFNSFNRAKEMMDLINTEENMFCLDGDIILV